MRREGGGERWTCERSAQGRLKRNRNSNMERREMGEEVKEKDKKKEETPPEGG